MSERDFLKRPLRVDKTFTEPSLTQQSFKKECDINEIMRRFKASGDPAYLQKLGGYTEGLYGDFSDVPDYRTALEQVKRAGDVFGALPAKVRARFSNDPAEFLDFCQNPANADELVNLGLATRRVAQDVEKTPAETQS